MKPVWGSGKIFILDSRFCVLKAIIDLKKKGVFAAALIKKQCYWPKYIPGDAIITHFWDMEIGASEALQGELDNVKFHIVGMKEHDYGMMIMTTYGTLAEFVDKKTLHGQWSQACNHIQVPRSCLQPLLLS